MWIKSSNCREAVDESIDAMQLAFARLRQIQAKAERCWQELQQIDAREKWLLVFDAEFNKIQSEWDKAFTEFHRLAAEVSDLIIEEDGRRFGASRHRRRIALSKRFAKRGGGALVNWAANGKPNAPIATLKNGADHGSWNLEIDLPKL